jgi:hypothetical protein
MKNWMSLLVICVAATGCNRLAGYERVFVTRSAAPGAFTVVNAVCPAGKKVLGGGFQFTGEAGDVTVFQSFPQQSTDANGNPVVSWQVAVTNKGPAASNVTSWATCAQ